MNNFTMTILGNGSAVPTAKQNPSAQLVFYSGKQFLIDCGEGTQIQMIKHKVRRNNLDNIFISHLHGDHYYGLIGLLNTFHLMRRKEPLNIFAPSRLKKIIDLQLEVSNTKLFYPLHFRNLEDFSGKFLLSDAELTIEAFPLLHSVPVWGFLFKEKTKSCRLNKDFVKKYNPSVEEILAIKKGGDYMTQEGLLLSHEEITLPPHPARSFAYCSDTAYQKLTVDWVKGVDLLYHEATFDSSEKGLAKKTLHSTATDAALVAKEAGVSKLLLGHFSARYTELDGLLSEARELFPESYLSREGETYPVG
jgi:ribonuclease Z